MALFVPSPLMSRISGSLYGMTFQNQKGKAVVMQRARQRNTRSALQLERRKLGAQRAQEWRDLTDTQRSEWAAAAEAIPGPPDAFGIPQQLSPYAFFLWQRMDFTSRTFPPLDVPAFGATGQFLVSFSFALPVTGPWPLTSELLPGSSGWDGPMFISRPMTNTEPKRWPAERMIKNKLWTEANTPDIRPAFQTAFGNPIIGEWLRFRTHSIMNNNWFKGSARFYTAQVTP